MYQSKIFKSKMKEIMRQNDIIESLLKAVKDDYGVEGLTNINETFPYVKSEFIKIFGQYPIQISWVVCTDSYKIF